MAKVEIVPTLYPVIYAGPKEVKTQIIPGRRSPVVFNKEPDGTHIAYVTELEARWIAKVCGPEFTFPKGLRNPDDKDDLWGRIENLTAQVEELTARLDAMDAEPVKRTRKPKGESDLSPTVAELVA